MREVQLILARHGRTSCNQAGRIQGHSGSELDEVGRQQAESLARRLQREELIPDHIYSSDLVRARQTAKIIADSLQVPITTDSCLRECGFGSLEGLTHEAVIAQYGPDLQPHLTDRGFAYDFRLFGGEQRSDVITRQETVLNQIVAKELYVRILVVGHGRSLNNLLAVHWPDKPPINQNCDYRVVTWPPA